MKKNIIIAVLLILTLAFGIMSLINKIEADRQRELNEFTMKEAIKQKEQAEKCAMEAQIAAEMARIARDSATAKARRATK